MKINLIDYIPYGRKNAVSRRELSRITGLPDRRIRLEIKRILNTGEPILSSSRYGGYWRSDSPEEWAEFLRESDRRIRTERRTTEKLRERYYAETGTQITTARAHTRRIGAARPEGQIPMHFIGGEHD